MSRSLPRRVEQLQAQCKPAEGRVRYVWWDRSKPMPEAAPGERLVVISWADSEPPPLPVR